MTTEVAAPEEKKRGRPRKAEAAPEAAVPGIPEAFRKFGEEYEFVKATRDELGLQTVKPSALWAPAELNIREIQGVSTLEDPFVQDIASVGVQQSLTVIRVKHIATGEEKLLVAAGHRRLAAALLAGLKSVPINIVPCTSISEMVMTTLRENHDRQDMSTWETACAIRMLCNLKTTPEEIKTKVGLGEKAVDQYMRLFQSPEPVQALIAKGALTFAQARALSPMHKDPASFVRTAEKVAADGWSEDRTREEVKRWKEKAKAAKEKAAEAEDGDGEKPARSKAPVRKEVYVAKDITLRTKTEMANALNNLSYKLAVERKRKTPNEKKIESLKVTIVTMEWLSGVREPPAGFFEAPPKEEEAEEAAE